MMPVELAFEEGFETNNTGSSAALVFGVPGAPSFHSFSGTASAAIAGADIPATPLHSSAKQRNRWKVELQSRSLPIMRHLRINVRRKVPTAA